MSCYLRAAVPRSWATLCTAGKDVHEESTNWRLVAGLPALAWVAKHPDYLHQSFARCIPLPLIGARVGPALCPTPAHARTARTAMRGLEREGDVLGLARCPCSEVKPPSSEVDDQAGDGARPLLASQLLGRCRVRADACRRSAASSRDPVG